VERACRRLNAAALLGAPLAAPDEEFRGSAPYRSANMMARHHADARGKALLECVKRRMLNVPDMSSVPAGAGHRVVRPQL
jgi:hypothetical protein